MEILLVEDNPSDVELTLRSLKTNNLTNRVHVARDGAEALDFIFGRGAFIGRSLKEGPKVSDIVKPVDFAQFTDAVRHLGLYWILYNQPPAL